MRRRDRSLLWFSIYVLNNGFRLLTVNERIIHVIWPGISGELAHRAEYASICISVPLGLLYIRSLFPDFLNKTISRFFGIAGTAFAINALFGPYKYFLSTLEVFYLIGLSAFVYILYTTIRLVRAGRDGSWLFFFSFAVLVVCAVNDILHNEYVIDSAHLAHYGFFGLILGQSIFLARKFTRAYVEAETVGGRLSNLLQFQQLIVNCTEERSCVLLAMRYICRQFRIPVHGDIVLFGKQGVPGESVRVSGDRWESSPEGALTA